MFEIGDVLEYKINENKHRCMVVGFNQFNKDIMTVLSEVGGTAIWNEDINSLSVEYSKIGNISLWLLMGVPANE